ncbi:hypothetical protein OS175_04285 [Marinicella sp. S1101]|nr:hypothetical protein [Marinicella marina]MCX7553086.1 hypothetical protein [Marinicella marina]MDJ1138817.1 hypothetical protein [Marinicella marina]
MRNWWQKRSKQTQQKLWFLGLWLGSVLCLLAISYSIRLALM